MNRIKYRTLLFDFGMVLVYFDRRKMGEKIKNRYPRCLLTIEEINRRIWDSDEGTVLLNLFEMGMITASQYRMEIARMVETQIGEWDFWAIHTSIFTETNRDLIALIAELRSRHRKIKRVIGVTDIDPVRFPVAKKLIEKAGLTFDNVITSFGVECLKTDPRVWKHIHANLGVDPLEAVFVDDLDKNVEAARGCGFTAIRYPSDWLAPAEATHWLRRQFRELGFRV